MKLIQQHNNYSCLPTAIAMLTEDASYRKIKNYCRRHFGYSISRRDGCTVNYDSLGGFLKSLGHDVFAPDEGVPADIRRISKYNEAVVCFQYHDGGGHAVAWDGSRIFDPSTKYTKPHTLSTFWKIYKNDMESMYMICVKVHPLVRLTNRVKEIYYRLRCS